MSKDKKQLIELFIPIYLQAVLHTAMGTIDTLLISFCSDNAVAAVGLADNTLNILYKVFGLFSMAIVIIVPQYIGASTKDRVKKSIESTLIVALTLGIITSVLFFFGSSQITEIVSVTKELGDDVEKYFRIVGSSFIFYSITVVVDATFRCFNIAHFSLIVALAANIINLIGDYPMLTT